MTTPEKNPATLAATRYYDAFATQGDFSDVPFAKDVAFQSPNGLHTGAEGLRAMLAPLAKQLRSIEIRHQLENDGQVVSVYDFDLGLPGGAIPMCERLCVRNGEIVEMELVFDTARMAGGGGQ